MTATTNDWLGVGARRAFLFELNTSKTPKATGPTIYEGFQLAGAQALNMTIPDVRKISHKGDTRVLQVDYLPPEEGITVELTAASMDFDVYAKITNTLVRNLANQQIVGMGTEQQGNEPQFGMMVYQQAVSRLTGIRKWRTVIMPVCTLYPQMNGMNDEPMTNRYIINPAVVHNHLWGELLVLNTDGYVEGQVMSVLSDYKLHMGSFLADGTEDKFDFNTARKPVDVATVSVFENGVLKTAGITKNLTDITYASAPANNTRIDVLFESLYD